MTIFDTDNLKKVTLKAIKTSGINYTGNGEMAAVMTYKNDQIWVVIGPYVNQYDTLKAMKEKLFADIQEAIEQKARNDKRAATYIDGPQKIFFGMRPNGARRESIYFSKPSFDCGWYWGFGFLGNHNCHYHLDGYQNKDIHLTDKSGKFHMITEYRNKNMYDCLLGDYELNPVIKENLWEFCELVSTIYTLQKTAEIYHRGGGNYTTNPCKETLKDKARYDELTFKVLPELIRALWELMQRRLKKPIQTKLPI